MFLQIKMAKSLKKFTKSNLQDSSSNWDMIIMKDLLGLALLLHYNTNIIFQAIKVINGNYLL